MRQADTRAHFIHEGRGLLMRRLIQGVPRVGDEVRLDGPVYYTVTSVVWVYDEPDAVAQRVNIGLKNAIPSPAKDTP